MGTKISKFYSRHKRVILPLSLVLLLAALVLYSLVFFQRGIKVDNCFLTRSQTGNVVRYSGSTAWGEMAVSVENENSGLVTVTYEMPQCKPRPYTVELGPAGNQYRNVAVLDANGVTLIRAEDWNDGLFRQDGEPVFGDGLVEIEFSQGEGLYKVENPYESYEPSVYQVSRIAQGADVEMRGSIWFMLLGLVVAAIAFLDIKFPLLYFKMSHWWCVENAQPTDFYMTLRVVRIGAAIVVAAVLLVVNLFI